MKTALILVFTAALLFAQAPAGLLPSDDEVTGWNVNTGGSCYSGEVSTSQGLYDAIDGGAGTYINVGFAAGAFEGYSDGSTDICVEIYDQASAANAAALYDSVAIGEYRSLSAPGTNPRLDTAGLFTSTLEFTSEKYFVRIVVFSKSQTEIDAGVALGQVVADNAVAVEKKRGMAPHPSRFALKSFPDPARSGLWFELQGNTASAPSVSVYDARGRLVSTVDLCKSGQTCYKGFWNGPEACGRYTAVVRDSDRSAVSRFTYGN